MMSSAGYRGWRLSVFLRSLTHDAVVEGARRDGRLRRALRHGAENADPGGGVADALAKQLLRDDHHLSGADPAGVARHDIHHAPDGLKFNIVQRSGPPTRPSKPSLLETALQRPLAHHPFDNLSAIPR